MSAENIAVVRRLLDEVWNQRAFDVLEDLFAAAALVSESGVPFPIRGPLCAKEGIGAACAAFPDIWVSIEDIFAADTKVVVRWSSRGTHRGERQGIPPTNRPVTMTGMAIYRFADGKMVEEWMNTDRLGMLRQLGVSPG
jgi:predicted ester cyclase